MTGISGRGGDVFDGSLIVIVYNQKSYAILKKKTSPYGGGLFIRYRNGGRSHTKDGGCIIHHPEGQANVINS